MVKSLEKYDIEESINVGDLISYWPETNKVTKAIVRHWKDHEQNKVVGVCTKVEDNIITFINHGPAIVNVKGLVCLGDRLTASDVAGIARAIKYEQDETKFRIRHLGKVIELYDRYDIVKVMLDIE